MCLCVKIYIYVCVCLYFLAGFVAGGRPLTFGDHTARTHARTHTYITQINHTPNPTTQSTQQKQDWDQIMDRLLAKYATRLLKLGVDEIEIKVR